MLAPTFEILLVLRFVEGIGAAATRVMAVAIARDCFQGRQMAKVMSLVLTVFLVMPIFAPNIGAAIMVYSDWHGLSVFLFLFGISVLVWVALRLPETLAADNRRPLRAKPVLAAFRMVVTNRSAFSYTIATGLIFASLFAFISQAEQIYTGIYGLGAAFTLYFLIDRDLHGRLQFHQFDAGGALRHANAVARRAGGVFRRQSAASASCGALWRRDTVLAVHGSDGAGLLPVRFHRHKFQRARHGAARQGGGHGVLGSRVDADAGRQHYRWRAGLSV